MCSQHYYFNRNLILYYLFANRLKIGYRDGAIICILRHMLVIDLFLHLNFSDKNITKKNINATVACKVACDKLSRSEMENCIENRYRNNCKPLHIVSI